MKQKKHTHGFKVPETYFADFEERLFTKLEEIELPMETGFTVPEGYFETMEKSVLERLDIPKEKGKVIPLFFRKVWGYAASVAACAAFVFFVFNMNKAETNSFNNLQFSAVSNYIEGENLGLDMFEIESILNEEEINEFQIGNDLVSDAVLEEYLLENVDVSMLLNQ